MTTQDQGPRNSVLNYLDDSDRGAPTVALYLTERDVVGLLSMEDALVLVRKATLSAIFSTACWVISSRCLRRTIESASSGCRPSAKMGQIGGVENSRVLRWCELLERG